MNLARAEMPPRCARGEGSNPPRASLRSPRPFRPVLWTAILLFLFTALIPRGALADTLDDVLQILAAVGIIDQAVVEAKPVIECVIGGGSVLECTDAVAHVKAEAKSAIAPNDPRVKQVIDIYTAASAGDWLKVFRLGGSAVACGLVPGGTVKDFFCGALIDAVIAAVGDKFDAVYHAIAAGDWWGLLKLASPSLVCKLMPAAIEAVLCNEFLALAGKAVELAGKAAAEAANAINNIGDDLLGQKKHIPLADYYQGIRLDTLHGMINERVVFGRSGDNLYNYRINKVCVEYFDAHTMSNANAKKVCGEFGKQLREEVEAGVAFAHSAVDAYYRARLEPQARAFAATEYFKIETLRSKVVAIRDPNLYAQWGGNTFHGISPEFAVLFFQCGTETYYAHPLPAGPGGYYDKLEVYNWICFQAVGERFTEALVEAKTWYSQGPHRQLSSCQINANVVGGPLQFSCGTYQSLRSCRTFFAGLGTPDTKLTNHCALDVPAAVGREASRIARSLGARRCSVENPNTHSAAVVCTRSWKQRRCASMVEEAIAGLPYGYTTVKCRYEHPARGESGFLFTQRVAATQAIVDSLRALPGRNNPGAKCRVLRDPLAIRCDGLADAAQVNALMPGLALTNCPADPNNDGADDTCYSPQAEPKRGRREPVRLPSRTGQVTLQGAGGQRADPPVPANTERD